MDLIHTLRSIRPARGASQADVSLPDIRCFELARRLTASGSLSGSFYEVVCLGTAFTAIQEAMSKCHELNNAQDKLAFVFSLSRADLVTYPIPKEGCSWLVAYRTKSEVKYLCLKCKEWKCSGCDLEPWRSETPFKQDQYTHREILHSVCRLCGEFKREEQLNHRCQIVVNENKATCSYNGCKRVHSDLIKRCYGGLDVQTEDDSVYPSAM